MKVECKTETTCELWDNMRGQAAAGLRSKDKAVRSAARQLIKTMDRLVQAKATYVITNEWAVTSALRQDGGGITVGQQQGAGMGAVSKLSPYMAMQTNEMSGVVLMAHEAGHADGIMNTGGAYEAGARTENLMRIIVGGCKLRKNEDSSPPPCP